MTTTLYPLHLVHDNPWNERPLDAEHVARLAKSIETDSLLHAPLGRRAHPTNVGDGAVQLAFGHHRVAAYRQLYAAWKPVHPQAISDNPWATIPIDVREIDDRRMARYAIVENHSRADPSAIEKARSLLRLTTEPAIKMSQADAGELFGLGQGQVSHLIQMLKLPADVQALGDRRELSENALRSLIPIARWNADAASKIAQKAARVGPEQRTEKVEDEIYALLRDKAISLRDYNRPWPITWPEKPLAFADFNQSKGEPSEIPACKGCPFAVGKGGEMFCLRAPCFAAKGRLYDQVQLAEAAAKLGIPVATAGERVTVVYPLDGGGYDYQAQGRAEKLVKSKHASLRLALSADKHTNYQVQQVLGTDRAVLVTTDAAAVAKFVGTSAPKAAAPAKAANESALQKERRINAERELAEERKLDRMAYNRSRADVLWIVEHTAELIASRTVAGGGMLLFAIEENRGSFFGVTEEMREATEALSERAGVDRLGHGYADGTKGAKLARATSTPELDELRRQYLAYRKLTRDVASGHNATDVYGDMAKARKACEEIAVDTFAITLPAGWDTPPTHHTPINCWECGRFSAAGSGKLTQGDAKEGWKALFAAKEGKVVGADAPGAVLQGVWCPQHAAAGFIEWNRASLKARGQAEDAELAASEKLIKSTGKSPNGVLQDSICNFALADVKRLVLRADLATLYACQRSIKHKGIGASRACLNLVERQIGVLKFAAAPKYGRSHTPAPKSNARAAAKAAASARELAARLKPNGRGHTRPAPKPAAKRRKVAKKGSK